MSEVCVLNIIFPSNEDLDMVEKKLVESLGQEIRKGELLGGAWERYILIEPAHDSYFYLSKHKGDRLAVFGIISSSSLGNLIGKDLFEFLEKIGDATSKLDPLLAYWYYTGSFGGEVLMGSEFEYYAEPYFFCLEPTKEDEDRRHENGFLFDGKNRQKIEEIKKVMPREELLKLLEKHSKKLILGKCGAGIIKEVGYDAFYPRYFVRKAVRGKNINLPEGFTELLYYDLEFEKEPENAGKMLDIVNNNLEKISLDWRYEIKRALRHAFKYKPKETYKTFEKYCQMHKLEFSPTQEQSIGRIFIEECTSFDEEYAVVFLDNMVEVRVLTQKEASDLKIEYSEAKKNRDNFARRNVLGKIGKYLDKKFGGIQ